MMSFRANDRTLLSQCSIDLSRCLSHRLLILSVLLLSAFTAPAPASHAPGEEPAYLDPSLPISVRIDDLMKRMTLKEKIGQLNLPCVYVDDLGKTVDEKTEAVRKFAAGTYTTEIGPGAGFFTLADTLRQKDLAWRSSRARRRRST